jgi:UDP-N-acetylglucosamine--N-acetylmuramyl-(pentapeptide) pyrophosphoryl-undecaprenol N-acetylglucosamine transferase
MKTNHNNVKLLFATGGTGGHIFPALAVAKQIKQYYPNTEILFVGSNHRIEMHLVPQHGFPIVGLSLRSGLKRNLSLHNFKVLFQTLKSLRESKKIIKKFKPNMVIGFGGYVTGPVLKKARCFNIPTAIQEQNAFPGLTNRLLSRSVNYIFTAFDGMENYFNGSKIIVTGNPVRPDIVNNRYSKEIALKKLELDLNLPVLLVLGGTLGAKSINHGIASLLEKIDQHNIQLIWQTGKNYISQAGELLDHLHPSTKIIVKDFFDDMALVYAAADAIIARAGALTIAELQVVGKPTILIPSPNVTHDHQMKNALKLKEKNAIILLKDEEINEKLWSTIEEVLNNKELQATLSTNLKQMARPDAAEKLAHIIMEIAQIKSYVY